MELVRTVASDVLARHLADWMWLPELEGLAPFAVTAFGDVFLSSDDGVWFLDTIEGRVERKWDDHDALRAELETENGRSTYLLDGLVDGALRHGVAPGPDQVLLPFAGFVVAARRACSSRTSSPRRPST